ncbi:MAG: dienelactone hydrolase family protein [Oligoflexales bacterium]
MLSSFWTSYSAYAKLVDYKVEGKLYEGYYLGAGKKNSLVLILHDWDGLTDYEVKRAKMLQKDGYSVFAADLFGKGVRPTEVKDKKQHTGELYKDRKKMRALVQGAVDTAKKLGANTQNIVVMGYCFGGAAVLEFARSGAKALGFAASHGGLKTPNGQNYGQTQGKVLIFHGSADSAISLDDFAQLGKELEQQKVDHEMVTYSGAPHAFTVFGSKSYQKVADSRSWKRFSEFLAEAL